MVHRWYTIREMENIAQKTRSTIYRWIDAGKLEVKREDGRVLVRPTDGIVDIPSEPVENGTGGQAVQQTGQIAGLMGRMEKNAELMTQYMTQSLKEIRRLERMTGELTAKIEMKNERIEELEILLANATHRMTNSEKLQLIAEAKRPDQP